MALPEFISQPVSFPEFCIMMRKFDNASWRLTAVQIPASLTGGHAS
jgi:hypothetical protein